MKCSITLLAIFGLAVVSAETASAQGFDCPFGRGSGYVSTNLDRAAAYADSYGLSECRDGVCPHAQRLSQQSRSYQSQPQRPWDSLLSPNRVPTGDWRDDRRPQTYNHRFDEGRPTNYNLRDSRNEFYDQPSTNRSQSRHEPPTSYDRPQTYERGLTSDPSTTFDRSLTNSRAPMDDFQAHQHDGTCNHDHGPVNSTPPNLDRRQLENLSPRYAPQTRQLSPSQSQFNSPQQPRPDQPISEGPPPLPPRG